MSPASAYRRSTLELKTPIDVYNNHYYFGARAVTQTDLDADPNAPSADDPARAEYMRAHCVDRCLDSGVAILDMNDTIVRNGVPEENPRKGTCTCVRACATADPALKEAVNNPNGKEFHPHTIGQLSPGTYRYNVYSLQTERTCTPTTTDRDHVTTGALESPCGPGTVWNTEAKRCIGTTCTSSDVSRLIKSSADPISCGLGTHWDSEHRQCTSKTDAGPSLCGPGTQWDSNLRGCIAIANTNKRAIEVVKPNEKMFKSDRGNTAPKWEDEATPFTPSSGEKSSTFMQSNVRAVTNGLHIVGMGIFGSLFNAASRM